MLVRRWDDVVGAPCPQYLMIRVLAQGASTGPRSQQQLCTLSSGVCDMPFAAAKFEGEQLTAGRTQAQ